MPDIRWFEAGVGQSALWRSENGTPPPARVVVVDDRVTATAAYRLACERTALLWRGDFHNARQVLAAMGRRADRKPFQPGASPAESFHRYRRRRARRARILGRLLVALTADHRLDLRRAPDVRDACAQVYGPPGRPSVLSLRELLGVIGAYEWRRKGVEVSALGARVHPHYGVFAPVRGEYVDLVARAPLPVPLTAVPSGPGVAFDIGTGTGVLAAVLARRGVGRVVATDTDPRALACAEENVRRLGMAEAIEVVPADLFPPGRATLVVCNPPWLPGRPTSRLEQGVYDPDGRMLRGFLHGLADHLEPGGEGWLILSDLAEHLGLRPRRELLATIAAARLRVVDRIDIRPRHRRASEVADPLHAARAAEVTSLWRLGPAG